MIAVLFDTNIYDLLAVDQTVCDTIRALVEAGHLRVIVSRTIAEELSQSPFGGVPELFPYEYLGNTVGRTGIMCAGDALGAGEVFDQHLGNSTKANDAFVVDAASWYADWLVSEDQRLRKRAGELRLRAQPMAYQEFLAAIARKFR